MTLIQTGKVKNFPVILYGKEYWAHTLKQLEYMYEAGTIGKEELSFIHVVDSVDEATDKLQEQLVDMWKERNAKKDTPKWWFLEEEVNTPVKKKVDHITQP